MTHKEIFENYSEDLKEKYPHIFPKVHITPERMSEVGPRLSIITLKNNTKATTEEIKDILTRIFSITDEVRSLVRVYLEKEIVN